ncbi:HNH endonuclease signature motif containing protein [Limosilactobacillus ingluviei]|uniref:HNH endonuclease signature motif containing protein n=1 Tax=Limosilactobacillus ingluviei TaxID=148604 RepID=UPI0019594826|nr:HNH endonuclease signature motif containing protein [Limosilactobacillus ingluviei]MBM6728322.1 HNH endonuclease [Limosilactobacillus ingluviei]
MSEVKYKDGYAYIDGYKFRKDDKSGYYLSTKKIGVSRKRLHIYVWEKHHGSIPKGMEINHIDENKDNNEISNLECLTRSQHLAYHKKHDYERMVPKWKKNLENFARPKAAAWHKSKEGRASVSQSHTGLKYRKQYIKRCINCGKVYRAAFNRSKFCSTTCQAAYRRKQGKDNIQRTCSICGKTFWTNKYSKKVVCSKKCRSKKILLNNKVNARGTTKLKTGKFIGQFGFMGKKYHTTVFDNEEDAYKTRNKLIDKILSEA